LDYTIAKDSVTVQINKRHLPRFNMSLQICVLASGSSGNCTYVGSDHAAILIDMGISARETSRRLEQIGADLNAIQAVCITHEHHDHTCGLGALQRKHKIPAYANAGTLEALMQQDPKASGLPWTVFQNGAPFQIGDLSIEPFSVPHDAFDPVGFIVRAGDAKVGIVTDMGIATELIRTRLKGCRMLVLESNHDEQLVKDSSRPWHLKQRILSRQGHLSNGNAAEMLTEIAGTELQQVFLAHISDQCNRHDLALGETISALSRAGLGHIKVSLTFADRISEIWRG